MGKIKGWKKVGDSPIRYNGIGGEDVIVSYYLGKWIFSVEYLNEDSGNACKYVQSFKTKQKALDYAMKYMRGHPHG